MKRQTSVYLDLVRFTAALVVFIGHTSGQRMTGGFLWPIAPFMSEAVTIFFVLSGFVIGYVRDQKELSASTFIVSRAARIYSVALPALVLTFSLDAVGKLIDPNVYSVSWGYNPEDPVRQLVANTLFVNRLWFSNVTPGSNLPFWSLGYEVWYYVIFATCTFLCGGRRIAAVILVLVVVGPQIAVMFPIWLLGLGCYHLSRIWRIGHWTGYLMCVGCLIAWAGYEIWAVRHGRLVYPELSGLGRPELVQDYLVAALFAGHLLGFNGIAQSFVVSNRVTRFIRWVAGATFSIYLFHLPITQVLTAMSPWPQSSTPNRILLIGGTLAIVFLLAEVTERKKEIWRVHLSRLVLWIIPVPLQTPNR